MKEISLISSHKTLLDLDSRIFKFADILAKDQNEEYQSFINTHYNFLNKFFFNLHIHKLDIKSARLYLIDRILDFQRFLGYNIYHQEYHNISQFPVYDPKRPVVSYFEIKPVIESVDKMLTALLSEQEYEKIKLRLSDYLSIDSTSDITGLFAHYHEIVSQVFSAENFKRLLAKDDFAIINGDHPSGEYKSKIIAIGHMGISCAFKLIEKWVSESKAIEYLIYFGSKDYLSDYAPFKNLLQQHNIKHVCISEQFSYNKPNYIQINNLGLPFLYPNYDCTDDMYGYLALQYLLTHPPEKLIKI